MQAAERIEAIATKCREIYHPFPEALINAICQYLLGQGTLALVQKEWKAAGSITSYTHYHSRFIILSNPITEHLDELDLRLLDICLATNSLSKFFSVIAVNGPIFQARDYARAQGTDEATIIEAMMTCYNFVEDFYGQERKPTTLGRLLLTYIPDQFDEILKHLNSGNWSNNSTPLFTLLMLTRPDNYLDLGLQVAQHVRLDQADQYTAELLKADLAKFSEWARQIARSTIQHQSQYEYPTLEALLALDPAQHIDLAVEAAKAPPPTQRWYHPKAQCLGIEAAYRLDPITYLPLVAEAATASHPEIGKLAVNLLKDANFEQACPILQQCVAKGHTEAALSALDELLKHEWPERQAYMLSVLPNRSKQVRDALITWLVKEGDRIVEPLAPSLAHSNADARLATVQALQQIGGERAMASLSARLDLEKSNKVKQAILDVIGVAALADASQQEQASPIEALTAEAEAALKRITKPALLWFDPSQMPRPRWQDGEPVPPVVLNYLVYRQSRVKNNALDERIGQALPLFDRSGLGDLALAQFNGWLGHGAKSEEAWCFPLVCALADERLIFPLRQSIDGWTKGTRGALAAKAVGAMALIESDLALAEINELAERVKHSQVKHAAQKALDDAAAHRNISLEELSDLIVPALGFDDKGERAFDYGSRQFTARLLLNQTLQVTDSAGKRITTLPKPGARDDESKAKTALAAWSLLKKQAPQVIKMQTQRLENALINQRAWSIARWQALFLKHPVLRSFAITLVWGIITPEQTTYQTLFRPLEDSSLTDAEDNTVQLPAEGIVRMAHPVELDEATRSAWLQHLADYEVAPSFSQLNRPIVRVSPDECNALWWEQYKGYLMNGGALKGRFLKAGWERGSVQDAGAYYTIWKAFPAAGVQAILETAGMSVGYEQEFTTAIKRLAFARTDTIQRGSYIYDDLKEKDERSIKLGEVPPIIFSEIAADVQNFAAAGEYREDWEKKVW
ncbi:MAG TPA: DUF4132 domain-containing protein [Ktedonobacterales bacterium]|nr:DUF4132 domain-containing protein [Ktedonobacterales bacterium]